MPQSRIAVFVLLTLAIAGAALLWWSTSNKPTSIQPTEANAHDADPAAGTVEGAADREIGAGTASLPLLIPNTESIIGVNVNFQAVFLDAGAPQGVSMTNGVEMWIG